MCSQPTVDLVSCGLRMWFQNVLKVLTLHRHPVSLGLPQCFFDGVSPEMALPHQSLASSMRDASKELTPQCPAFLKWMEWVASMHRESANHLTVN